MLVGTHDTGGAKEWRTDLVSFLKELYCSHMTLFGKAVVALFIIIIGGGGYYFYQSNTPRPEIPDNAIPVTTTKPETKKIPFSALVEQMGTYKCTVNQYVQNIESKGTVYMDKGMIRSEFNTSVNGMNIGTTMIVKDGYTYSWSSMMPTMGYKARIVAPETSTTSASASTSGTYSWNAEQIGDYNCESWTADATLFTIPSTIKFTTVN
jgi:hypothetical protein